MSLTIVVSDQLRDACISSSVWPLVSGTSFATKTMVNPHTAENMKKVPEQNNNSMRTSN